ncbi:MAG: hypothetical protein AAF682_07130 [Planctomycetota bacterium]
MTHIALRACTAALALAGGTAAQGAPLFSSDFETDDGGLTATLGQDWEHGVPTAGPGAAHSGAQCWGTNLDGAVSGGAQTLALPTIDASAAAGAPGIVVRWWQYFDEPDPLVFPFPGHRTFVTANSGVSSQTLFGRWITSLAGGSTDLPHVGWRQVVVVLGPDYATQALDIAFRYDGSSSDGMYVDDVSVEVLAGSVVSLDDFEAGPGGFAGDWQHGEQTGCPLPVSAASGTKVWSTNVDFCSHGTNQVLTSPVLDLAPYDFGGERREAFLTWSRFARFEAADGVHHEISYDGGTTWELGAGWHLDANQYAAGFFSWTGFGVAADLARGTDVRLRWRVTADDTEFEYGMWLDDFAIVAPQAIGGSGANPVGSLTVSGGGFALGGTLQMSVEDPADAFPTPAVTALGVSLGGDANLPAGTPLAGFGLSAPGAPGDLLIDAAALIAVLSGPSWAPGGTAQVDVPVPGSPSLAGTEVFLQGALLGLAPPRVGLTNGLFGVLAP